LAHATPSSLHPLKKGENNDFEEIKSEKFTPYVFRPQQSNAGRIFWLTAPLQPLHLLKEGENDDFQKIKSE
jgi:hypothetical protein